MSESFAQSSLHKLKLFRYGMVAVVVLTPLVVAGYIGSHHTGWDIIGSFLVGIFYIPMYAAVALLILAMGYAKQRNLLIKYALLPRKETWLRLTYVLIGWFSLSFIISFIVFFIIVLLTNQTS